MTAQLDRAPAQARKPNRAPRSAPRELPFPGAVDHDGFVTFTIYAPRKKLVSLMGEFNDWRHEPMKEVADGLWSTERELPRGSFCYQFLIEEEQIICDPYARRLYKEPRGGPPQAVIKVREDPYVWLYEEWDQPQLQDMIIFELHVADFTPERNIRGAMKKLDHIADLGCTAIELMPIFESGSDTGWGYTPEYLFAVHHDYGAPNELRSFVDEAHKRGIAVLLDIVLAHTAHNHPFNRMYRYEESPWYGLSLAGKTNEFGLPTLDFGKPATEAFARDVVQYWLQDFHVDGFRFDYAKLIGAEGDKGMPALAKACKAIQPGAIVISEVLPEDPQFHLRGTCDATWHLRFSRCMRALMTDRRIDQYDPGRFDECIKVLDPRHEGYDRASVMINYLESHDEERLVLDLMNAGCSEHLARMKSGLCATLLATAAGEPMYYHGQGWGEKTPKNMEHNFIIWETLATPAGRGLWEHYRRMFHFRRQHIACRTDNLDITAVKNDQRIVVYHRWHEAGDEVVVAANVHEHGQEFDVPLPGDGRWAELFTGQQFEARDRRVHARMPSWGACVYFRPG